MHLQIIDYMVELKCLLTIKKRKKEKKLIRHSWQEDIHTNAEHAQSYGRARYYCYRVINNFRHFDSKPILKKKKLKN